MRMTAFAVALTILTLIYFFPWAAAAEPERPPGQSITVRDAIMLLSGLRNLDGRPVVVDQGGQKTTVVQPWEFKSGALRLRIASDVAILAAVEKAADEARIAIVKQVRAKRGVERIEADPAAFEEFSRLYDEVLNAPATGTEGLARIKASELRLDVNEIGVTVLSALQPILDQDVK